MARADASGAHTGQETANAATNTTSSTKTPENAMSIKREVKLEPTETADVPRENDAIARVLSQAKCLRAGVAAAAGEAAFTLSREERRKARMAFARSQVPASDPKKARAEKMPEKIAEKLKQDPSLDSRYFELYIQSQQSWALVTMREK